MFPSGLWASCYCLNTKCSGPRITAKPGAGCPQRLKEEEGSIGYGWALRAGEEAGSTGVLEEETAGFAENEDKFGPQGLIPFRDFYCKK